MFRIDFYFLISIFKLKIGKCNALKIILKILGRFFVHAIMKIFLNVKLNFIFKLNKFALLPNSRTFI